MGAVPGQHVHVPTPGDHYSPATGSAIMTIIYELSRRHEAAGGRTRVVVAQGTRHDYPVGECIDAAFHGLPDGRQKAADALRGLLGLPRRLTLAAYEPALAAIEPDFDGVLFVHNSPAPVDLFKRQRPRGRCGLYVHNALFRTYGRREVRRTVDSADFVVCNSVFIAERLTARLGRPSPKLHVVHNGVDLERFRPSPAPRRDEEPVVLFVGRVVPEKGPDLLVRAARKLLDRRRRFRVRIVGSRGFSAADPLSPYERRLRELAEPLREAVEFQPFVDRHRIAEEYGAASIFCMPSNWDEPCSLTLPEALACALPAVVSRRGGLPEIGRDAVLYFRPPDVDELADALAHLIDDGPAREEWGRRARARAAGLSWSDQYERLQAAVAA